MSKSEDFGAFFSYEEYKGACAPYELYYEV